MLCSGWNKDVVERRRRNVGGSGASVSLSLSLDDMLREWYSCWWLCSKETEVGFIDS